MRLSKKEKKSIYFILSEFITLHKDQHNIYEEDIEVAKKVINNLRL
jgi:hypothetical protein